jgi:hypothetical protein
MEAAKSTDVKGINQGILHRYFGTTIDAFNLNLPFFGYGLGFCSNAGNEIGNLVKYKYFNADQEWSMILGENGALFGTIIILIKVFLSIFILKKSYRLLIKNNDSLPWMLCAGVLLTLPLGNAMGNNTVFYGVMVLLVGFCLTLTNKMESTTNR